MCKRLVLTMFVLSAAMSCSKDSNPAAPSTVQVGGVWRGTETLTAVSGGECFAAAFQAAVGTAGSGGVSITQSGANLTATTTEQSGANSTYNGTAGQSSIALTWASCTACNIVGATCPNGARRDLIKQSGSVNASVAGSTMTGTEGELYNVFVAGTQNPVGTLSFTSSLNLTRQ